MFNWFYSSMWQVERVFQREKIASTPMCHLCTNSKFECEVNKWLTTNQTMYLIFREKKNNITHAHMCTRCHLSDTEFRSTLWLNSNCLSNKGNGSAVLSRQCKPKAYLLYAVQNICQWISASTFAGERRTHRNFLLFAAQLFRWNLTNLHLIW